MHVLSFLAGPYRPFAVKEGFKSRYPSLQPFLVLWVPQGRPPVTSATLALNLTWRVSKTQEWQEVRMVGSEREVTEDSPQNAKGSKGMRFEHPPGQGHPS